jgi:carnitine 3-dehydrogenase
VSAAAADRAGVRRVAVLGAGTIGASWTALFLAAGLEVSVYDPAEGTAARVREFVAHAWPALGRLGLARTAAPAVPSFHAEPAAAVAGADWVQENGPESLEAKRALYAAMARWSRPRPRASCRASCSGAARARPATSSPIRSTRRT